MAKEKIRPLGESMEIIRNYNLEFFERGDPYGSRMGIALGKHQERLSEMSEKDKVVYASKVADSLETGTLAKEPPEA